jgi:hypothetical protein
MYLRYMGTTTDVKLHNDAQTPHRLCAGTRYKSMIERNRRLGLSCAFWPGLTSFVCFRSIAH